MALGRDRRGLRALTLPAGVREPGYFLPTTASPPAPHTHTPTDIVPQGAGSGLDADLLDGLHAAAFQPVDADLLEIAAVANVRGDLLVTDAAPAWTRFGIGAADEVLTVAAGGLDPDWRKLVRANVGAGTGTSDTFVFGTAPTFTTSIITPVVYGGAAASDNLDLYANDETPIATANAGRIRLRERVTWPDNVTISGDGNHTLMEHAGTASATGRTYGLTGFYYHPTLPYNVNQVLTTSPAFRAGPIFQPTASVITALAAPTGFLSEPQFIPNGAAITPTMAALWGFLARPGGVVAVGTSGTITDLVGFGSCQLSDVTNAFAYVGAGITATAVRHFWASNIGKNVAGTITTQVGVDVDALSGGSTNLSFRAAGTSNEMRQAGPAKFGANSAPDTTNGNILEVERTLTLGANVADGQAAGLVLDPGYTGGFTVTRHNYLKAERPSLAGGAALTDACVLWFDAAAGTHEAVAAHAGAGTPTLGAANAPVTGDPDAWVKINVNGVVMLMPAWTP